MACSTRGLGNKLRIWTVCTHVEGFAHASSHHESLEVPARRGGRYK